MTTPLARRHQWNDKNFKVPWNMQKLADIAILNFNLIHGTVHQINQISGWYLTFLKRIRVVCFLSDGASLSWKILKCSGMCKTWLSMAILNSDLLESCASSCQISDQYLKSLNSFRSNTIPQENAFENVTRNKAAIFINPLTASDAIWQQRHGSTLAQVMACCLMASSYYLNQCWLIISKV